MDYRELPSQRTKQIEVERADDGSWPVQCGGTAVCSQAALVWTGNILGWNLATGCLDRCVKRPLLSSGNRKSEWKKGLRATAITQ